MNGAIPRFHVIAIGGSHQYLHFLPAAFELSRRGSAIVTIFVLDDDQRDTVEAMATALGYAPPSTCIMHAPAWLRIAGKRNKIARLLYWASRLRNADALYSAERTSTLLKRLPGHCPLFIHSPHGFGDRAVGFEARFSLFDHVIVAGQDARERLVALGRVTPDRCHVAGPVKLAAVARMEITRPPLFPDSRPVILYNPHSDEAFSSFNAVAARLIDDILADGRYNLVVAPHVKLAQGWADAKRASLMAKAVPGRVIVDLGSSRSSDMSYTLGADCYVGDVSSQVYEFLTRPRPCLFINAHKANWIGNPDYAMWTLGPVASADGDLLAAIDHAFETHSTYRGAQAARLAETLSSNPLSRPYRPGEPDDIDRTATLLERLMTLPTRRAP